MKKYTRRQLSRAIQSERGKYEPYRLSAFDLKYCVRRSPFGLRVVREGR